MLTKQEIESLWAEYTKGPDYYNVRRWADTPTIDIEGTLFAAFRAGVRCATDPDYLNPDSPAQAIGSES